LKLLREYQKTAVSTGVRELLFRRGFGYILGMGLGKTIVTLRTLDVLKLIEGPIKALVTCPSKVMPHWGSEAKVWGSLNPVYTLDDTELGRLAVLRQNKPGIYVVSHALLQWLEKTNVSFDCFIVDEGSKFRNWTAKQTKAARRIATRTKYRLLLTGTATPNDPGEIFSQQFLLDLGKTLGSTVGGFQERFCYRGGYENREWIFNTEHTDALAQLVAPWYLRQDTLDHLSMPVLVERVVPVELPMPTAKLYKKFERELFAQLDSGEEIMALSGSGKYNLCRQIASGGAYLEDKSHVGIHDAKIEALRDLMQESNRPTLVAYYYKHEQERLQAAFPTATFIKSGIGNKALEAIKDSWKAGNIKMLVAQADSISHGVDGLQHGGADIVWFTLTDHPEAAWQLIARIWRQGQHGPVVTVNYLIANRTIDVAVYKLLAKKEATQAAFLKAVEEYRATSDIATGYSWAA
jgi:SNF2 family DNA or RNA helicase